MGANKVPYLKCFEQNGGRMRIGMHSPQTLFTHLRRDLVSSFSLIVLQWCWLSQGQRRP